MITFGSFILGAIIMAISFVIIKKAYFMEQNFGDISYLLGFYNQSWLSWKTVGLAGIVLGFLVAFGLIQEVFILTLGRIFSVGIDQ